MNFNNICQSCSSLTGLVNMAIFEEVLKKDLKVKTVDMSDIDKKTEIANLMDKYNVKLDCCRAQIMSMIIEMSKEEIEECIILIK